jgi:hypothetical protein
MVVENENEKSVVFRNKLQATVRGLESKPRELRNWGRKQIQEVYNHRKPCNEKGSETP